MNEIQVRLLELLDYFHKLCCREGLTYYVIGGTALGVVRHGGFIPWDDDIDVGMPREDYEKLKVLSKGRRFDNFIFEYAGESHDFVYPLCKMYDTTTTLAENTRFITRRGIYLDIFPLDGVGNTMEESRANFWRVYRLYRLLNTKVCGYRKGRKWYKNFILRIMQLLPDFILSPASLICRIDNKSKERTFYGERYVANLVGDAGEKEILRREIFGTPTLYQFEGINVNGPERIEEFLTCIYGDWRQLPPVEKQVSHHDFLEIDLNKPYKIFQQ